MRRVLIAMSVVAFLLLFSSECEAQLRGPQGEVLTRQLVLARLCAHEASMPWGWDQNHDGVVDLWTLQRDHRTQWGDDCLLIHHVILRGVERMRAHGSELDDEQAYIQFAIDYSHGRLLEPREGDTNRWAVYLMPGPRRPEGWTHGRWSAAGWRYAWDLVGGVVEMTLEQVADTMQCDGPVHDWGGRSDGAWASAHGRVIVHCREGLHMLNTPYRRPWLRD